jgi:hypothetical protein
MVGPSGEAVVLIVEFLFFCLRLYFFESEKIQPGLYFVGALQEKIQPQATRVAIQASRSKRHRKRTSASTPLCSDGREPTGIILLGLYFAGMRTQNTICTIRVE